MSYSLAEPALSALLLRAQPGPPLLTHPFMKVSPHLGLVLCTALVALNLPLPLAAAPPAFRTLSVPEGWSLVKGETDAGAVRSAKTNQPLELRTAAPMDLPVEAVFRFRALTGDSISVLALGEEKNAKPLLQFSFRGMTPASASLTAQASGDPMETVPPSIRRAAGNLNYGWRFPVVKNLWSEEDRREIGASYAKLFPFEEKTFTARIVLTKDTRQIWVDDRLLAERRLETKGQVSFGLQLGKAAHVLSAEFKSPTENGRFHPLPLQYWSHSKPAPIPARKPTANGDAAAPAAPSAATPAATPAPAEEGEPLNVQGVPMRAFLAPGADINLRESLDRYRRTFGSGPDTSYVNALKSWPSSFQVDPAALTFRVPYRPYQTAWLLAWLDETPNAVPKGTFRFFRQDAGYPATTPFEINEETIQKGLVTPLAQKTADGRPLYLVKVPVETGEFYGFHDMQDSFLEFELTKPVVLGRSYPDPIYYGYHPAGLPSSVHVVGITLEEAAFDYEVKPSQTAFVFEQPEKPSVTVPVRNLSAKPLSATVSLKTRSFDAQEETSLTATVQCAAGETAQPNLQLNLKTLGWHELQISVEAAGTTRKNTLSLVVLPPNTRTYGTAANETRFGMWWLLGHYTPMGLGVGKEAQEQNEGYLAMCRKLGLRRAALHKMMGDADAFKRWDLLPVGPHTTAGGMNKSLNPDGSVHEEEMQKGIERELKLLNDETLFPRSTYFYGGEWGISREVQHAPWPSYTGEGDRALNAAERNNVDRHVKIFSSIGRAIRQKSPTTRLVLQWGAVNGTPAYIKGGFPKDLADMYGMDAPQFELFPEISNVTGSINDLWQLRQETQKLGWPKLPLNWTEGPFFPTNPGALSEKEQAEVQVRYMLLGLAYGVDSFESGIVPFDAGNYYGAEHYGAGIFRRHPVGCPKPAVAAVATMTSMLCGSDPAGSVPTDSLTTYCQTFVRSKEKTKTYALWRAVGKSEASLQITAPGATVTDSMGNARQIQAQNGVITVSLSPSPIWLTGAGTVTEVRSGIPAYDSAPAPVSKPLAAFQPALWSYDGDEDKAYANNHFAIKRITDPILFAEFGQAEEGHPDAVGITLPTGPSDKPLATRYGALKLKKPLPLQGQPSALGLYIKGNSSWGRVVFQLRDAKGEIWTSNGTKDDWNCDDTHAWSYVHFEGWRYVRFPLPSTHPWDLARGLETTWWGSSGGDGVVDYPLSLEKIFVEARNEVPVLAQMTQVPERTYKLSGLVAEYASEQAATPAVLAALRLRMPTPAWKGPITNVIAKLTTEGAEPAPEAPVFKEPEHFNDGRRMLIEFSEETGKTYSLYLSLFPDGRGAELINAKVKNGMLVTAFKPDTPMYLFLTHTGTDKRESKPSNSVKLITQDNFKEK